MFVRTGFFGGVALCFSLSDRSCDIRKVGADGKTFVKQVRRADSHLGKPSFSLKKRGNGASISACYFFIQCDGISYTAHGRQKNGSIPAGDNPATNT